MKLFPIYYNMENKSFLIVGGGRVALEKLKVLQQFGVGTVLVAKASDLFEKAKAVYDCIPEQTVLEKAVKNGDIILVKKEFEDEDVMCADFVIAATDDLDLNLRIMKVAHEKHRLVDIADRARTCDFVFPAIIKEGDLTVTVSTNAKSPAAAAYVKKLIKEVLPVNISEIITAMGAIRKIVSERIPLQKNRKRFYDFILRRMIENKSVMNRDEIIKYLEADIYNE